MQETAVAEISMTRSDLWPLRLFRCQASPDALARYRTVLLRDRRFFDIAKQRRNAGRSDLTKVRVFLQLNWAIGGNMVLNFKLKAIANGNHSPLQHDDPDARRSVKQHRRAVYRDACTASCFRLQQAYVRVLAAAEQALRCLLTQTS